MPPPDTVVTARLLSTVSSNSDTGSKVSAIVSEPFYSADRHLILPEGTRLIGTVVTGTTSTLVPAFGKMRLRFQEMELPDLIAMKNRQLSVEATVARVDPIRKVRIKIDDEGVMKSIAPRTRFIAPAVQMFLGVSMLDETIRTPSHKMQTGFFERSPERRDSGLWAVLPHNSLRRPRPESDSTVQPGQYSTTLWHEEILFSWRRIRRSKFGSEQRTSSGSSRIGSVSLTYCIV